MGNVTMNEYNGDDDMETVKDVLGDLLRRVEPRAVTALLEAMVDQQEEADETQWQDRLAYLCTLDDLTDVVIGVMEQRDLIA